MRRKIMLGAALLAVMVLVGCAPAGKAGDQRGNSTGNIVNGGLVASSGGWVYYRSEADGWKLYKSLPDGSEKVKICDDMPSEINVVDEYVYYANFSDGLSLYRIKADGTGRAKLFDGWAESLNIVDGWAYFARRADAATGNRICKMRLDGSELTELADVYAGELSAGEDAIFFTAFNDSTHVIHRMNRDGAGVEPLNRVYSHFVNVQDGWLYFWNVESGRVHKMKTDGTESKSVNAEMSDYVNVDGEWIYYVATMDGGNICRIRTDGTGRQKLTDFAPSLPDEPSNSPAGLWTAGEDIFFRAYHPEERRDALFRLRKDGSELVVFDSAD